MSKKKNLTDDTGNKQPVVAINAQYVKNLSFESPNSPTSLTPQKESPKVDISLDLEAKEIQADSYEISLQISAKTTTGKDVMFVAELTYSGLFTIKNIPEDQKELVLLIHCPTILFPFARRVLADATRDGGFQPLMVDPIDFNALYQQRNKQNSSEPKAL